MDIIEIVTPFYDAAWLPWAVQYFFLIGIAATTALFAASFAFARPGTAGARLLPALVAVLLVTVISAPLSLLADLHQPGRFWHFYWYPTPWSWMNLGAFFLPVFLALAFLFAALWWWHKTALLRLTALLLALSALTILLYTGAEIMVIRARPLWATIFVPINLALTGALSALGAALLIARWLPGGMQNFPLALTRRLAQWVTAALVVAALAWAFVGAAAQTPSFTQALDLLAEFGAWRMALLGSVLLGLIMIVLLWRPVQHWANNGYALLVALFMLAAAWVFRWILFMAVQTVPKYGAGLYLESISWGGDGVLGMVGVFGLVIAMIAIVTYAWWRFPPRRPSLA